MGEILGASEKRITKTMNYVCDIILLSYESPGLLKKCVESVLDHTRTPSRLIIVDNASKDPEVKRYLEDVKGRGSVEVMKVLNGTNAGFAGGMNIGLKLAEAPFVCLLNNDCVVARGWLEEMINVARISDKIGLVNPQSSTFGSWPSAEMSVDDHAATLAGRKGRYVELGHAIGFACLVKKEVLDRIGFLDEAYRGVCYEDTDFAARAAEAGFISVMAEGAYVFHSEQASRGNLKGKEDIYKRNREIFEKRWGRLLRVFVIESGGRDEGETARLYEKLKGVARERAITEIWMRDESQVKEVRREIDLNMMIRHADISVRMPSGRPAALAALLRTVTKKKKFDAVILEEGLLHKALKALRPFHGSRIFSWDGDSQLRSEDGKKFDLGEPGELASFLRNPSVRCSGSACSCGERG